MNFSNHTNIDVIDGFEKLENGTEIPIFRRGYDPTMDSLGPTNTMPFQCYTSVDFKYKSPVIGIIKNGNKLEEDLRYQFKEVFANQEQIGTFADKLTWYFDKFSALLGGGGDDEDDQVYDDDADDDDARGTEARCHDLAYYGYPGSRGDDDDARGTEAGCHASASSGYTYY